LTKKDLVDDEMLELATMEATEVTQGTCLEGAPIIAVSSVTEEGVARIREEIEKIIDKIPPKKGFGAFFLPIDRVFSKKGLGSVVTGTSYQGSIAAGDEVVIMPSGIVGKVRSLQTHGAAVASVTAGQRVAVNLSAVAHDQLERGDAVCAKGAFAATRCMNAWLDILPSAPKGVSHWQRVRLHAGTVDAVARISLLRMEAGKKKAAISPGSGGPVQILTESNIVVTAGQRFMIRFYSPLITIGGGRIMLPNAEAVKGRPSREAKAAITEALADNFGPVALLAAIVRDKGILTVPGLFALSQMEKPVFEENRRILSASVETYGLLEFGTARNFISGEAFDTVARSVLRILRAFHAKYPERAGIDAEKLSAALADIHGADTLGDFKELLGLMAEKKGISPVMVQGKTCYRAAGHSQSPDKKLMELVAHIKKESAAAGFNLVKLSELEEKLNIGHSGTVSPAYMKRTVKYLHENEDFSIIDGDSLLPPKTRDLLLETLAAMTGDITVAALRDAIGVNRKQSLAMLDFLDSQGITRRDGDKRVLKKQHETAT
jgi:selenocysteine-specific elongation factor